MNGFEKKEEQLYQLCSGTSIQKISFTSSLDVFVSSSSFKLNNYDDDGASLHYLKSLRPTLLRQWSNNLS